METVDTEWADEQMAAAEAEIEQQKKEWEMERLAIDQADARSKRFKEDTEDDDDVMLTYSSEDAKNQVNNDNSVSSVAKKGKKKIIKQRLGQPRRSKEFSGTQAGTASEASSERRRNEVAVPTRATPNTKLRGPSSRRQGSQQDSITDKTEVKSRLKVEAIRLEQLPLLSENGPDSNLIAKSLARMRRKS